MSAKNLDGVNFDFEGEGSADQDGLTSLITQVSHALHAANPHWQVTMATYASAAGDPDGFYNIAALAPAVDGFFVMAYDMNNSDEPSATAPLVGGGFNDTEALQQYTAVVPASKVILGVPYYGYDWPTTDGTNAAQATGGESPLSDGVIAASGHPTYWDPSTDTVWTSYQVGTQWHETYFDNPTSLAMKAAAGQLVPHRRTGHLGPRHGRQRPGHAGRASRATPRRRRTTRPARPPRRHRPPAPPGTGFVSNGTWSGVSVPLNPITPPPPGGTAQYVGTLGVLHHDRSSTGMPADRTAAGRLGVQQHAGGVRGGGGAASGLRRGHVVLHTDASEPRRERTVAVAVDDHDHRAGVDHDDDRALVDDDHDDVDQHHDDHLDLDDHDDHNDHHHDAARVLSAGSSARPPPSHRTWRRVGPRWPASGAGSVGSDG